PPAADLRRCTPSGRAAAAGACRLSCLRRVLLRVVRRSTVEVGRELDDGAVLPEPLERVVDAVLGVLDVRDDLTEVEEDPPGLGAPFATDELRAGLVHGLLDRVADRGDLALVARGRDEEDVGEHELLRDVEGDDLLGLAVGGCACGDDGEVQGALGGGHGSPSESGRVTPQYDGSEFPWCT